MIATYEPGTVAVATVRGVPNVRVVRCRGMGVSCWFLPNYSESQGGNGWWPDDEEVTDVHPLVVLDPSEFIAENLVSLLLATAKKGTEGLYARRSAVRFVADQIEAQTRPPKPAEPTGWLAAVEDAEGNRWTVTGGPTEPGLEWYSPDLNVRRPYDDIDAVRVIFEGVAQ